MEPSLTLPLPLLRIAVTAVIAGILGGSAMLAVMRLISRAEWAKYDMIVAVGSMVTRSRENAFRAGAIIHTISAIGFALLYSAIMWNVVHGMIVSLLLVWIVSEQHPLEEFREAGLAVGLVHFAGHVAFGAVVGLVVGVSSSF